jgi:hypothetical protein
MILINKLIISNRYIKYSSFWWWYRLINHEGFRFDDYYVWKEFWYSINSGWCDMNYQWEFEKFWGKGAKPERIVLPAKDFDALVERLNAPPDPKVVGRLKEIMSKKAPWDDNDE